MKHIDVEQVVKDYLEQKVMDNLLRSDSDAGERAAVAIHRAFAQFSLSECVMQAAVKEVASAWMELYGPKGVRRK